jgi:hypothetical protein
MSNRRLTQQISYNFDRVGAFGRYVAARSIPLEFIQTTFTINELDKLSYARDVQTVLNFEFLMQRDIDESRAIAQISEYLLPSSDTVSSEKPVFLPPLIAAIVPTDSQRNIELHLPQEKLLISSDSQGEIFTREWGNFFQVTHYGAEAGCDVRMGSGEEACTKRVDISQARLALRLGINNESGVRLVVIDGQHRLFALRYLRDKMYSKVSEFIIPVCILYSPQSTSIEGEGNGRPAISIPEVLRRVFVDVNSTVERVSGHFFILLSDDTLGSIICRTFCEAALSKGREALAVIEWNTKSHKESQTISRSYSVTSIGVLDKALAENFGKSKDARLLWEWLQLDDAFPTSKEDSESEDEGFLGNFPWRDFSPSQKAVLAKKVETEFVPCLTKIFLESKPYSSLLESFKHVLAQKIGEAQNSRTPEAMHLDIVKDHLLNYIPLPETAKHARVQLQIFLSEVEEERKHREAASILTLAIFQRGVIYAWRILVEKFIAYGFRPMEATDFFVLLLSNALARDRQLFSPEMGYNQNVIFNGVKIRPQVRTREHVKQLILAVMGSETNMRKLVEKLTFELPEELHESLVDLGFNQATDFIADMIKLKEKSFKKLYKTNLSLSSLDKEKLLRAEAAQEKTRLKIKNGDTDIEVDDEFDKLVSKHINEEVEKSKTQLQSRLSYRIFTLGDDGYDDDDDE